MAGADLMRLTVTVTWMDGQQETYVCLDARTSDGELTLAPFSDEDPRWVIPLANVRIWTGKRG